MKQRMKKSSETRTALAEKRKTFVADALAAEKEIERAGRAYPAGPVHRYLRARVSGRKTKRPKPAFRHQGKAGYAG